MQPIQFLNISNAKFAGCIKQFSVTEHPLSLMAQKLLYTSDYACRHLNSLQTLLQEDNCQLALTQAEYQQLITQISLELPAHLFAKSLRQFRHRHLLRLILRELAKLATTEETMASWSDCADAIIIHTMAYCEQQLIQRYGLPRDEEGSPTQFFVLAMGKLGGGELNFSSDIDLIFAYSANGITEGSESITNQQFYNKAAQQFIQLLQNVTADGFVFRVDLRLRPNGESGPLVCALAAMEIYYQEQGRDWERYAMVKARLIDGKAKNSNQWYNRLITPFVYRRYVDFSVIASLRSMKAMIEREVELKPMLNDIKRGWGGIREVEFIVQCFQLIRGGRLPQIQQRNTIAALAALKKEGLLERTAVLQQAYLFLRKLENALQTQNDQQTHTLPTDEIIRAQILVAMNYESWEELTKQLDQYRRIINQSFHSILSKTDVYEDEKCLISNQLTSLWQGHVEATLAINLLTSLGFQEPERCYQMIHAFRHSPRCRRLSQAARMRLDRFMVMLLGELATISDTDKILLQVLNLLENIVGRSAYLALLTENPSALQELLHWFAHSPFITSLLVSQPFLLEVLIDQQKTWRPMTRRELQQALQAQLAHCEELELQDELLRQFKLTCWLLAARAELYGQYDAVRIGQFLADVAEVIIAEVVTRACEQLSFRYPEIMQIKSRFAIVSYGKLGSREMNYDSDVDLVFLHKVSPSEENLVTRLTQKILHMLTMRSQSGVLYSVDTRLRPSGAAGLLVSHMDAFIEYQRTQAWTWEHQALLKTRVLFATRPIKSAFTRLKEEVLFLSRDKDTLRQEVQAMRVKIGKHQEYNFIKHSAGGLLDLEFLVQFLMLAHPFIETANCANTLLQLELLVKHSVLTKAQFTQLKCAYQDYHQLMHQQLLSLKPAVSEKQPEQVLAICQTFGLLELAK